MTDRFGGLVHTQPERLTGKKLIRKRVMFLSWATSAIGILQEKCDC